MKILMVNLPFAGHSNPTMGLATELVKKGHQVSYIHSFEWEEKVNTTGAQFIPYAGTRREKYKLPEMSYWRAASATVENELPKYDVLIYEVLFFPGKSIADRHGKPSVRLISTFAINQSILKQFADTGGPYLTMAFRYKWLQSFISKRLYKSFHLGKKDIVEEIYSNAPALNFTYTVRDFQINAQDFPENKYYFIGPSLSNRKEEIGQINYSSLKKPLIYISMGTIVNHSKCFYEKCFDAFRDKEVSVILSVGCKKRVSDFSDVPDNFSLHQFVPQLEVLQNCDLFITHGGMNSVNESLYYGVPMLVAPVSNDQPTVAARVEELRLGKRINAKRITPSELYSLACEVLQNSNYKSNATIFKEKALSAGGNSYAVKLIEEYF